MKKLVRVAGAAAGLFLFAEAAHGQTFLPAACDLDTGHYLVKQGFSYLRNAATEQDTTKRQRTLSDALRSLTEAVLGDQVENPAAWYYLGRYYEIVLDGRGADSAYARAQAIKPECADDIELHKNMMWPPLMNGAIEHMRVSEFDQAADMLRGANALNANDNIGFYYLARILAADGENDSSLAYFKRVAMMGMPEDTSRIDFYHESVFNTAILYNLAAQSSDDPALWDSAATWYQTYRTINPNDNDALTGIVDAYQQLSDSAKVMQWYDTIVARYEHLDPNNVFRAGEHYFVQERFAKAREAFEKGLTRNPYSRPALHNLANTYLAVVNAENTPPAEKAQYAKMMEEVSRRLLVLDPDNRGARQLLGAAFQLQDKRDSAQAIIRRIEAMRYQVIVDRFFGRDGRYTLNGRLQNFRRAQTTTPQITFEFVDAQGNVVTTATVESETLPSEGVSDFTLEVEGDGLMGWRYRVES